MHIQPINIQHFGFFGLPFSKKIIFYPTDCNFFVWGGGQVMLYFRRPIIFPWVGYIIVKKTCVIECSLCVKR